MAANGHQVEPAAAAGKEKVKLIIDTDPGIDDSVAIMMAFQAPGVDVLGLTTISGNCTTAYATRNALILCEMAGRPEVPVAEGSAEPLKGGKPHVASFVHGPDGPGNVPVPEPTTKKAEQTAAEFLVDKVSQFPGEVSVLTLGPLTNVALAIKMDPSFVSKVKRIVVLGGAFFAAGNATPSAEANIHSDPEAADMVFTSGADIVAVGLNITTQVGFTQENLSEIRNSEGKHAQFLCDICKFYSDWHFKSYGDPAVFLHDPVSLCGRSCSRSGRAWCGWRRRASAGATPPWTWASRSSTRRTRGRGTRPSPWRGRWTRPGSSPSSRTSSPSEQQRCDAMIRLSNRH